MPNSLERMTVTDAAPPTYRYPAPTPVASTPARRMIVAVLVAGAVAAVWWFAVYLLVRALGWI